MSATWSVSSSVPSCCRRRPSTSSAANASVQFIVALDQRAFLCHEILDGREQHVQDLNLACGNVVGLAVKLEGKGHSRNRRRTRRLDNKSEHAHQRIGVARFRQKSAHPGLNGVEYVLKAREFRQDDDGKRPPVLRHYARSRQSSNPSMPGRITSLSTMGRGFFSSHCQALLPRFPRYERRTRCRTESPLGARPAWPLSSTNKALLAWSTIVSVSCCHPGLRLEVPFSGVVVFGG